MARRHRHARMPLLVAATLTAGLAVSLAVAAPASGRDAQVDAVTIHGPARAGYGAVVTLTGSAPANTPVLIYFHRKGSTGYIKRRTLTSDANGHYATTYVADTDYRYYAVANGTKAPSGLTQLPTASCSTSAAIAGALPFSTQGPTAAFATIQASNGHGRIAGFAYDGGQKVAIIARDAGHPFSVVGRLDYGAHGLVPLDSVHVDAVTRAGGVLVDAEPTNSENFDRRAAFAYTGGRRYELAHAANWTSVVPAGVTAQGTIVGVARVGPSDTGRFYLVSWAGAKAPYKVLVRNGTNVLDPTVALNGSITYSPDSGQTEVVRLPSGQTVYLDGPPGLSALTYLTTNGTASAVYGMVWAGGGQSTIARWDVSAVPASGRIPATLLSPPAVLDWMVSAGLGGAVVAMRGLERQRPAQTARYLRTAAGALVKLPTSFAPFGDDALRVAVDGDGSVAYTAQDRLPHILRCH